MLSLVETEPWTWKKIDDGSGRAELYISSRGEKTRLQPADYVPELLINGERKYYYKGSCIRCKKKQFTPIALSGKNFEEVFCFNICEKCIVQAAGLESLKGRNRGNTVWDNLQGVPKIGIHPIRTVGLHEDREVFVQARSIHAKSYSLRGKKHRRNLAREIECTNLAMSFDGMEILTRKSFSAASRPCYISWGFAAFDEYFGEAKGFFGDDRLLCRAVPSGMGVKFYSDRSVYNGEWVDGLPHTEKKGTLLRPDGSQYNGTWLAGKRHGQGESSMQTFIPEL